MSAAKLAKERPAGQIYITIVGRIQRSVPGGSVIHAVQPVLSWLCRRPVQAKKGRSKKYENQSSKRRRDENIEEMKDRKRR
jgi:hypothetical protein